MLDSLFLLAILVFGFRPMHTKKQSQTFTKIQDCTLNMKTSFVWIVLCVVSLTIAVPSSGLYNRVYPVTNPFSSRSNPIALEFNGNLVVMGGWSGSANLNDCFYSGNGGSSWTACTNNPGATYQGCYTKYIHPSNGISFMMMLSSTGIVTSTNPIAGSWSTQTSPAVRYWSQMVAVRTTIFVLGGMSGAPWYSTNDVYYTNNYGVNWYAQTSTNIWPVRSVHRAVVSSSNNGIIVAGGTCVNNPACSVQFYNDVWISDSNVASWKQLTAAAPWSTRSGFILVPSPVQHYLYLLSGQGASNTYFNDVWITPDDGYSWMLVTNSAEFSVRFGAAATYAGNAQFVIAGDTGQGLLNDIWTSYLP